jgi:cytoskeletal protein CcmA (bactofilin family)
MWNKQSEKESTTITPQSKPAATPMPSPSPAAAPAATPSVASTSSTRGSERPTHIGKSISLKGTITGAEDLYVDGKVEGSIDLAKHLVTVGLNGQIQADVTAREVVILGKLSGNVVAADRVEIKSQGALTGDVTCARISIEDGAFFKGGIDIQKQSQSKVAVG